MSKTREYVEAVERGEWPMDPMVPLDDGFTDERGVILNLLYGTTQAIARISSRANTMRANHVHATDWHFTFVESGHLHYLQRKVGETGEPLSLHVDAGDCFFTPPGYEHAMVFPVATVIYTFARNKRTHEVHEADLTRVELVSPQQLRGILAGERVHW